MDIELEIKNYRCFEDVDPAKLILADGFTALIGPNNAGKSSALRFFFEFRSLFEQIASADQPLVLGQNIAMGQPHGIFDPAEIFCHNNARGLTVRLKLNDAGPLDIDGVVCTFDREHPFVYRAELFHAGGSVLAGGFVSRLSDLINYDDAHGTRRQARIGPLREVAKVLPIRSILGRLGTS